MNQWKPGNPVDREITIHGSEITDAVSPEHSLNFPQLRRLIRGAVKHMVINDDVKGFFLERQRGGTDQLEWK